MSGDRQWTILRPKLGTRQEVTSGPVMAPGEFVEAVEASRLTAVEAERDAYREGLEGYADLAGWVAVPARTLLARFPKNNETEQG